MSPSSTHASRPSWSLSPRRIIWQLLSVPEAHYVDLGAGFYNVHTNTNTKKRNHIRQLEALGYKVTLEPVA